MTGNDELITRLQAAFYLHLIALDNTQFDFSPLGLRRIDNIDGLAVLHRDYSQQRDQDGIFQDLARQSDINYLSAPQQPLLVI